MIRIVNWGICVPFLCLPLSLFSQTLHQPEAESFVRALLWQQDSLSGWFDEESLALSHRLGIEYDGVRYKNLIAYDLDDSVKAILRANRLTYTVAVDSLDRDHSHVRLVISRPGLSRDFYFRQNRCISPLAYFAGKWHIIESKHFRFFVSDSTMVSVYCVDQLEEFLARQAAMLGISNRQMDVLEREKIYYYFCRDEDEIERLTGYRARGMYNLAYDAVVTTFSNHYHELLHFLINYRLHRLPLYAHPLLQEGFAVAYGGRGGVDPDVLLPLGHFLYQSGFVDIAALRDKEGFDAIDPSMSYPAAALYTRFLVETRGMNRFLQLYRKHCGSVRQRAVFRIEPAEVPSEEQWKQYIRHSAGENSIALDTAANHARIVFTDTSSVISEDSMYYHFSLSGTLLVPGDRLLPYYESRVFKEHLPGSTYHSEKFLIRAGADEVSIYDLYTNTLLVNYARSFSVPPESVPRKNGRYCFTVRKTVFRGEIESLLCRKKNIN